MHFHRDQLLFLKHIAGGLQLSLVPYFPFTDQVEGKVCDSEAPLKSRCVKTTLREHHLACARALRADYCGDGTSFTQDGVPVSLFDGIGIRSDGEEWALEAEWDSNGARCVETFRTPETELPACLVALAKPDCGDPAHFESGATLVTEVEDVP